jgi:ribonuclease T1
LNCPFIGQLLAIFFQINDTRVLGCPGLPGVLLEFFVMSRFGSLKLVLTGFCLAAALAASSAYARAPVQVDVQSTISLAELPRQGAQIYALIHQGGPFETEKDGVVFGNRERLLPAKKRGYYREYTVPTPGLSHRGTKRIVCGGQPSLPEVCYYTADHYASFRKIVP